MGILQKKRRTTGKKAWRTGRYSGQNTGNDLLALGLRVVLRLPKMENGPRPEMAEKWLPKWENGPTNGIWAFFRHFFHVRSHFSAISGLGPFSIFFPIFPGFFALGPRPILQMATSIAIQEIMFEIEEVLPNKIQLSFV